MIHESSDVGEVKVSECLGTFVSSGVKRQKTSVGLEAKPSKAYGRTAGKTLLNLTAMDNIIKEFYFTTRQQYIIVFKQKYPERRSPTAICPLPLTEKMIIKSYTFYRTPLGSSGCL